MVNDELRMKSSREQKNLDARFVRVFASSRELLPRIVKETVVL